MYFYASVNRLVSKWSCINKLACFILWRQRNKQLCELALQIKAFAVSRPQPQKHLRETLDPQRSQSTEWGEVFWQIYVLFLWQSLSDFEAVVETLYVGFITHLYILQHKIPKCEKLSSWLSAARDKKYLSPPDDCLPPHPPDRLYFSSPCVSRMRWDLRTRWCFVTAQCASQKELLGNVLPLVSLTSDVSN